MKSSWTLLATVVLFSVLLRTIALEWPYTDGAVVEDRGDDDSYNGEHYNHRIRTYLFNSIFYFFDNFTTFIFWDFFLTLKIRVFHNVFYQNITI